MSIFNNDLSFWTGFYPEDAPFEWASNKAYLDMNRTMTFRDTAKSNDSQAQKKQIDDRRRQWRDNGTATIKKWIQKPEAVDFSTWHKDVCIALIEYYGTDKLVKRIKNKRTDEPAELTYGQAQKWLNMTLKYLWLLDRLGMLEDKQAHTFIQRFGENFHVPLDSYILRYVCGVNASKKKPFADVCNNELSGFDKDKYWKKFNSTWSQIDDKDAYYEYQADLANAIQNSTPLEWELIHWNKALRYYDDTTHNEQSE